MSSSETGTAKSGWRPMASAPKDGSRILIIVRGREQGPADVDVVRWDRPQHGRFDECWVSTDSTADCAIVYEAWEAAFWMPMPSSIPPVRTPDLATRLPAFPPEEAGGSGI